VTQTCDKLPDKHLQQNPKYSIYKGFEGSYPTSSMFGEEWDRPCSGCTKWAEA